MTYKISMISYKTLKLVIFVYVPDKNVLKTSLPGLDEVDNNVTLCLSIGRWCLYGEIGKG